MARNKEISSETHLSILVLRNEGYSMREIAKKLKISYNAVCYSRHRTAQTGSNQNRKSGRPRCTTEQEHFDFILMDKNVLSFKNNEMINARYGDFIKVACV
jgi:transposase